MRVGAHFGFLLPVDPWPPGVYTDLSEGLLGGGVGLLDADSLPVEARRLHALRGHRGVREAHEDGVVVAPHAVQADEVLLGHG